MTYHFFTSDFSPHPSYSHSQAPLVVYWLLLKSCPSILQFLNPHTSNNISAPHPLPHVTTQTVHLKISCRKLSFQGRQKMLLKCAQSKIIFVNQNLSPYFKATLCVIAPAYGLLLPGNNKKFRWAAIPAALVDKQNCKRPLLANKNSSHKSSSTFTTKTRHQGTLISVATSQHRQREDKGKDLEFKNSDDCCLEPYHLGPNNHFGISHGPQIGTLSRPTRSSPSAKVSRHFVFV